MRDIVISWLDQKTQAIKNNCSRVSATGSLENSIEYTLEEKDKGFTAKILGNDYIYWLENGRGPTSKTGPYKQGKKLVELIRKWIDDKPILVTGMSKDNAAYLIAKKIHENGIKVPNKYNPGGIVSNVINKDSIEELSGKLALYELGQIKSDVVKWLQA